MDPGEASLEAEAILQGEALSRRGRKGEDHDAHDGPPDSKETSTKASTSRLHDDGVEEDIGETSPLLGEPSSRDDEDEDSPTQTQYDFSHIPWYKRPTILWIIFPFFMLACAYGGTITPKVNLFVDLICREYMSEQQLKDPHLVITPLDFDGGANDQCRIPEVSSRVAQFTLWGNLITGTLAACMSPKLGALSDRYGRKTILVITSIGTILGELIIICAAAKPDTFPVSLLYLAFALDGMTGSFTLAMSMANCYAADCAPPQRRNVAFGYLYTCLFLGLAIGPILAGYIVKITGKIVVIFYILTAVHFFFMAFIGLCVPESLTKERQMLAREKHEKSLQEQGITSEWELNLRSLNIIKPLGILFPREPGSSTFLRRNLMLLAIVDTLCFGVAMGGMSVIIIYTRSQFGWESFESGRFLTIVNTARVFCLLVVLPSLTRLIRGKQPEARRQHNHGPDLFDLIVARVAIIFDLVGFVGYTLAETGVAFTLSGVVASIGGLSSPTIQAALTKSIPSARTGQLLGAMGLLHALARVVAPTIFNAIFSATVGSYPQAVFVCFSATFGTALLLSLFFRPHVYFDEDKAAEATANPETTPSRQQRRGEDGRLGIVKSFTTAVAAVSAALGISRSSA